MRKVFLLLMIGIAFTGCKYYGSKLPPDTPLSMDQALAIARNKSQGYNGAMSNVVLHPTRPQLDRPTYTPQKEMAMVALPRTLLVWTYPHITDDNTRIFGNWSTIFLNERYEWVPPSNEVAAPEMPFSN